MGHFHTGPPQLGHPLMGCTDYKHGPKVQFRATCVPACGPQMSTCQLFIVPHVETVVGHLHTHMLVFRVTRVDIPMATLEARVSLRMQLYMDTWWQEVRPEWSARRQ
jgi:hypothetical protein